MVGGGGSRCQLEGRGSDETQPLVFFLLGNGVPKACRGIAGVKC